MNTEHLSETLLSTGKEDDRLESLARNLLVELGEDPDRDGLERTPRRVAESLRFLTKGYQEDVDQVLNGALYEVAHDEMIIVRDIAQHDLTLPVASDPQRQVAVLYGTYKYPESYIISPQGIVHDKMIGAIDWDEARIREHLFSLANGAQAAQF